VAAGIVVAGFHMASALLVLGAPAAAVFLRVVHEDMTAEIRRDNRAVALSLAGGLVAMGNVLRLAISGPFEGWARGLASATGYAMAGLALLFAARWLTDWLLLPGVTIR
jgi:uncharacterized membrane protein YjfL (UPF0719 family)